MALVRDRDPGCSGVIQNSTFTCKLSSLVKCNAIAKHGNIRDVPRV